MENFETNKKIGEVFCRYLLQKFDEKYYVYNPEESFLDLILKSDKRQLLLQLKSIENHDSFKVEKVLNKSWIHSFNVRKIEEVLKRAEDKYIGQKVDISNIILIVHCNEQHGYLIENDADNVNVISNFRGIYLVQQEFELYGSNGAEKRHEFVRAIKDVFCESDGSNKLVF